MAVETVKSGVITNRDATPRVINNPAALKGDVKGFTGVATIANLADIASKYLFAQIPSNAILRSLEISSPDIGTTVTMDVGLCRTTADGGAVVDADFFKAAVDLHSGAIAKSNILRGNVATIAFAEKRVWELLALASDPCIMYDVVGTLAAASDAAGTVVVEGSYAV